MAAQALAVNGAKVYIVGRTQEKLDRVVENYGENIPGEIIPLSYDTTKKDQIVSLVKEISSREKCLCILINNAGINSETFPTEADSAEEMKKNLFDDEKSTFEDWEAVYRTNVAQYYFTTTAFLPLLQKSSETHHGWSSTVINIGKFQ
jgi:NAD(P)-dependent dehydrogenase (short-subunit alcohol dehydrogenase family)